MEHEETQKKINHITDRVVSKIEKENLTESLNELISHDYEFMREIEEELNCLMDDEDIENFVNDNILFSSDIYFIKQFIDDIIRINCREFNSIDENEIIQGKMFLNNEWTDYMYIPKMINIYENIRKNKLDIDSSQSLNSNKSLTDTIHNLSDKSKSNKKRIALKLS
jgi:hypothetical protein